MIGKIRIKEITANIRVLLQSGNYEDLDCRNCSKDCTNCQFAKHRNWFFEELEREFDMNNEEKAFAREKML